MAGSFVENINLLASKLPIIEESNEIFDEGVIPVLEEIAQLDLDTAIADLKKGNYLGNRKLDINLILNMEGVDETLLERNPGVAETIWTDVTKVVHYDRAFITFVDGSEVELPFMFDGSPITVTTHGDLLAQFTRLDYVYAEAQVDSIYQVTVGNSTAYSVSIDATTYTYTSNVVATRENIIAGIANMINSAAVPVTAVVTDNGIKINLIAKVPGNPFYAFVSNNMAISTIQANVKEGPIETAFLAKLKDTLAANFAEPVVGEIVRLYDIIGFSSNVERIKLNAVSGSYKIKVPMYYWANTTSAFQTLSMRTNDIIKLGHEIDNIILIAKSVEQTIELQKRIPQLVDTYDVNGNPNGDETIYNNLSELVEVHSKLNELITLYNDIKVGGTNYIQSIVQNLEGSNTIGIVASDLDLGVYSNINNTGSNIAKVVTVSDNIANVNTVASAKSNINLIVDTVIPNLPEILLADDKALIATNKALEATNAAAIATAKNNEMKNVSVGTTITGVPGTVANVTYNPVTSKFSFVIPKGDKGEKGEAFQINALGLKATRSLYDNAVHGFSFLAIDESHIYFKVSNTSGDWSIGSPFGKGDKGDRGDLGSGIVNTVFTSTTDPSGLPGQSGATDTYTINYDNLGTDTFTIKNGDNGLSTVIDTLEFKVLANGVNYTVNIDTTSGAFEVYFNGMLLPTSDYSLTGSAVIVNKSVVIGDEIIVKKIASVEVLDTYSQTTIDTKIVEVGLQSKNYTDTSIATGNSATTTKLHTPISINGVSFDGSSNITVSDGTAVKLTGNQTITGVKTFSSNIVGNVTGNLSGNATSATNATIATKLSTPRQINGVNFDGSADITVVDSTKVALTGNETIAGTKTFSSTIIGNLGGNASTATKLHTARTINGVTFDGSVAITVSDATAVKLVGDQTVAGIKTFSSVIGGNISGNSGSASKLATARSITMSGDVSGSTTFDGSGNVTLVAAVANDSHTHAFANLTGRPTTVRGYGITPEEMPANINLDTKTITGVYSQSSNTEATVALKYPVVMAGLLEVFAYDLMIHQRYWVYSSDDIYYRAKYSTGAWTAWTKGINANDIVTAATKLATARTINGVAFDGTANITAPTNLGITAGTTAGPVVTSSSGTNVTLPTASASASGVMTTGAQTFAGAKTFSSGIVGTLTGSITGNAASATTLQTARTINGVNFDGRANITVYDATKAPLASPALTGTPTAPTAAVGTNNTQIATTAFVKSVAASTGIVGGAATFTASGTWTCPAGVYTAFVRVLGGGGGGGGTANGIGPGGGGGAAVENTSVVKVTPGTAYTITIGAGGAGSTGNGGDGGNSSALGITGYGGGGGGRGSSVSGGKSGYQVQGAYGASSEHPYSLLANGSGTSGGCAVWMNTLSARAAVSVAGTLPGQGGGGVNSSKSTLAGKAGFRGQVYICW